MQMGRPVEIKIVKVAMIHVPDIALCTGLAHPLPAAGVAGVVPASEEEEAARLRRRRWRQRRCAAVDRRRQEEEALRLALFVVLGYVR